MLYSSNLEVKDIKLKYSLIPTNELQILAVKQICGYSVKISKRTEADGDWIKTQTGNYHKNYKSFETMLRELRKIFDNQDLEIRVLDMAESDIDGLKTDSERDGCL